MTDCSVMRELVLVEVVERGGQLMLIRVPLDSVTQILLHQMYFSSPVGSFNLHAALPAR